MARLLQGLRRVLGLNVPKPVGKFPRAIDTDFSVFREGDRVIVHGKNPSLTKPLRRGQKTDVRRGSLQHDDIIGSRVRDLVKAYKGPDYRLTLPTLEEYVSLTPRLVTPIYPADANLIVSLLDIHVAPPSESEVQPPLEILESGTGHGSLTLHLARAIQAANTNPPAIPTTSQIHHLQKRHGSEIEEKAQKQEEETNTTVESESDPAQQQWDSWRSQRKAILHTVDVSPKFSAHAEKTVRGFKRGIYAGNVDFYSGHVETWIAEQVAKRKTSGGLLSSPKVDPFLSYAILDMPSAHLRIPHVSPVMKRDGILVVFMPSITQIGDCVELIRRQKLPFIMDRVVELGAGLSSGRQWDVRFAVKKSRADPASWIESESSKSSEETPQNKEQAEEKSKINPEEPKEDAVLVCRPKVGDRIVGGGFIGLWRRIENRE